MSKVSKHTVEMFEQFNRNRIILPWITGFFSAFIGCIFEFPVLGLIVYGSVGFFYDCWHRHYKRSFSVYDLPKSWFKGFEKKTPEEMSAIVSYEVNCRRLACFSAIIVGFTFNLITPSSWSGHSLLWQVAAIITYPAIVVLRETWVRCTTNILPKVKFVVNPMSQYAFPFQNPFTGRPYSHPAELIDPTDIGGSRQDFEMRQREDNKLLDRFNI